MIKTDQYTKLLLSIIAGCLLISTLQSLGMLPTANANPENTNTSALYNNSVIDVNIKSIDNNVLFDINVEEINGYSIYDGIPVKSVQPLKVDIINQPIEVEIERQPIRIKSE